VLHGSFYPLQRPTWPFIPPGPVNEGQFWLGRRRQYLWFFLFLYICVGGRSVKLCDPLQHVPYLSASVTRSPHEEVLHQVPSAFIYLSVGYIMQLSPFIVPRLKTGCSLVSLDVPSILFLDFTIFPGFFLLCLLSHSLIDLTYFWQTSLWNIFVVVI